MKKITVYLFTVIMLFTVGEIYSQAITLDGVTGGIGNDTIYVNQQVQFNLRINSGPNAHSGITNGFQIYSPDGAEWTTTVGDTISLGWSDMFDLIYGVDHFSITGSGADTVGFGGAKLFASGLLGNFNEVTYTISIGPVDAMYHKNQICLDSAFYPPSGTWKWAGPEDFPTWDGPHCYTVIDPNAPSDPSNIVLSPDFLNFTIVEGAAAPPSQMFSVLTDQDPFDFTLVESASWIFISPTQGTSGQAITTTVNPTGLTAGTYIDSIEVVAPSTDNSSQWVIITLEVEQPPPAIAVTPMALFFNAVAGEANPADKIISISNSIAGSSDLNWSVSNSESWLTMSPSSGVNSGDVTVSVDITGLGFNDYVDTIIVSDPSASNDPVKIPVSLSVGSDLPLIAVDSAFNFLVTPPGVFSVPDRDIVIYNSGAGIYNFTITENSNLISSLSSSSGTSTDTISVGFKISGYVNGENRFDTLWIHSDEAANSPFPVVFQFHFVDVPAQIVITDTVEVDVFECDQGAFALNPQGFFTINNVVGGEAYSYQIDYESELFALEFETNSIPEFVSVVANDLQLPLGSYYDTITVSALNAINSPQQIIVKYNVIAGVTAPKIVLPKTHFVIPTRENEGPFKSSVFIVKNLYGGCMEWTIEENLSWLYPKDTIGNVPGSTELLVLADGITLGTYYDTIWVHSTEASNSPQKVTFELKVWKLAGDYNWNGTIDIYDLTLMVEHFFFDGAPPIPEFRVGDMNCDRNIDIADVVFMVAYMFTDGPIPCGNPY